MKLAFYILSVLLTVAWIIGFFVFNAGMLIHVLFISALLSFMQGIIFIPGSKSEEKAVLQG
jgi:hypothetical protein